MAYLLTNPKRGQNILTTLARMLEDRGYVLSDEYREKRANLEGNADTAREYYSTEETLMTAEKLPTPEAAERAHETALVMCPKEDKLAIDTVRRYVTDYKQNRNVRLLIVIQNITPAARQEVESCKRFELFYEYELYRNITQHVLYVPHRGLSTAEEAEILKKYRCKKENLPAIRHRSDPVARYFGWSIGTIVELQHRPGSSQEPAIYYRVVVDE